MPKKRLDHLLVDRQLVQSRSQAQRLIMAGQVQANGQMVVKPSEQFSEEIKVEIIERPKYVSRGGDKLAAALEAFGVDVKGRICADVGSSTGGFSDCLLQDGATQVYSIDVGKGILHWKIRTDPRITVMEGTNARYIERLPQPVSLITIDVSFISLKALLPVTKDWYTIEKFEENDISILDFRPLSEMPNNFMIALIKPQFEAGRKAVSRGKGVINDPLLHFQVMKDVLDFAQQTGYGIKNVIQSPLKGPKGNIEFLCLLEFPLRDKIDVAFFIKTLEIFPSIPEENKSKK